MIVRYGRTVPKGFLPVHSVWTEEQAEALLSLACPKTHRGEYVAEELAEEQTLPNLFAFGERLAKLDEEHGISAVNPNEGKSTKRPRCRDLVLKVIEDNPFEQFDVVDIARVMEVKHGHVFSDSTVRKALQELWKMDKVACLLGRTNFYCVPDQNRRQPTAEEQKKIDERRAAWQRHFRSNEPDFDPVKDRNLDGPPGLHPDDFKGSYFH